VTFKKRSLWLGESLFVLKKPSTYVLPLGCTKTEQLYLLYKRQSESNASIFISCNLQVEHTEMSENFTTPLPKAELFFYIVSKFVNSLLPSLNKSMQSCLVNVAPSPLQTPVQNIQQYLCTGIMVSSQAFSKGPHR